MIEKIGALLGAIGFLQFPQVYILYLHELKGHIAELKHQVALFEQAAQIAGKNLTEWIGKFLHNADPDFVLQGQLLQGMVDRLATFQQAERALEATTAPLKPFVFAQVFDRGIALETLQNFQWGLSFTTEALLYGCMGLLLGYAAGKILRLSFRNLVPINGQKSP